MQIEIIILVVLGVWLLVLTFVLYSFLGIFRKLSRGLGEQDLRKVLEKVLAAEVQNKKDLDDLKKDLKRLEEQGHLYVQKIGLVRFNPFSEMGGHHSFSLAILDRQKSGVVITGLHTRERSRIYAKSLNKGKSDLTLSKEEEKAIIKA